MMSLHAGGTAIETSRPSSATTIPFGPVIPAIPIPATAPAGTLTTPRDYDVRTAYLMSLVAGWAYADGKTLANKLKFYGFPNNTVTQISVTNDAMCVVATAFFVRSEDGRTGILAFRGTEPMNFINWLTDADLTQRTFHYGRVHTGFFTNVEAVWSDVHDFIEPAIQGKAPAHVDGNGSGNGHAQALQPLEALYITGHSLGAAMAVVAAAKIFTPEYAHWQPLVRGVYTFGQPAVGNEQFAQHYQAAFGKMLYRHVYRHDVVPRLPPLTTDHFSHFGEERFATSASATWETDGSIRAKQCLFVLATSIIAVADFFSRRIHYLNHLELPYSLDDHSPSRYIEVSRASYYR